MIELISKVARYLNVPEVSKDHLFKSLISFPISGEITEQYDNIRSCERKGMRKKEILNQLQGGGFDHLQSENIYNEYRSIRKVTNSHRGKRKFIRGFPILFLGVIGFLSAFLITDKVDIRIFGPLCIVSFICIIISAGATLGGLFQVITGWD